MLGRVVQMLGRPASAGAAAPTEAPKTSRGYCRPFGATVWADGVNFALFSRHAQGVRLVLFDEGDEEPSAEVALDPEDNRTGDVWHVFVHGLPPGVRYGYRVHGPFAPRDGHRFSPRALLLDPYARLLSGGHPFGARQRAPRLGLVQLDGFDWGDDRPPRVPIEQTVVYELHVRGYTRHPSSGVERPGTYLGLCEKIPHLKALGVTAVQLMPVAETDDGEPRRHPVTGEALRNYWGYSPLSFFAPRAGYASAPGGQAREMKEMVKRFHQAGLEVILDVVYNHTCEGNENGPTVGFRGLDNGVYYLLDEEGRYFNHSGCGNTLNCNHPVAGDLIVDSLTEWVAEYHVDGFRFDLAAILGRGAKGEPLGEPPLLRRIAEHPLLAGAKLIAEAWDAAGLNLQGKFPTWGRWSELNGSFRDDVRRFVRSEDAATMALAKRITGSLDLFGETGAHPYHSVNFVTCHDGFTLNDLVSYTKKNNWANGEDNRDGWDDNLSFNCGHDGPTNNPHVLALRQRQVRNFLTVLFLSQGVPLLLMGDEFGRTQQGNNNAYCQDNEIGWVNWELAQRNAGLMRFTAALIALRKKHFVLDRDQWVSRARWHGTVRDEADWSGGSRTLALELRGGEGRPALYVLFNAHWESQRFWLPAGRWRRLIDTSLPSPDDAVEEMNAVPLDPADHYLATARSTVVLIG